MVVEHPELPPSLAGHRQLEILWQRLSYVHSHHKCTHGKRGLLVYGDSGEGKTFAVKQYKTLFAEVCTKEVIKTPVFYYRLTESRKSVDDLLAMLILALGGTPVKGKPRAGELFHQFKILVNAKEIELFIIDEIQQVLPKTDGQRALEIVKFLCGLIDSEEMNTAFVFVGSHRAMRLLTLGEAGNTVDDNEQLSRRMLRPVKLSRIKPRSTEWTNVVNFFMEFLNFGPLLIPDDREIFDRLYLAYNERAFSTMSDLFLGGTPNKIKSRAALLDYLATQFDITGKSALNPFKRKTLDYDEVRAAIDTIRDHYFTQQEAN